VDVIREFLDRFCDFYVFGQRQSSSEQIMSAPFELYRLWPTASGKPASLTSARYGEVPKDLRRRLLQFEAQVGGTSTDSVLTRYNSLRRKKWQI
jgi:hypothetical protein